MAVEELSSAFDDYLHEARACQREYAQLHLLVGLETDVIHSGSIGELQTLLDTRTVDYVVGSVHHVNEIPIDFDQATFDQALKSFNGNMTALLENYFDAQYDLIQAVQPEVIGHFDLCRLYQPNLQFQSLPSVWKKIERNINSAVQYGALFEVNAAAFRKGWCTAYPGLEVLQVGFRNVCFIFGLAFTLCICFAADQVVGWPSVLIGRLSRTPCCGIALHRCLQMVAVAGCAGPLLSSSPQTRRTSRRKRKAPDSCMQS